MCKFFWGFYFGLDKDRNLKLIFSKSKIEREREDTERLKEGKQMGK